MEDCLEIHFLAVEDNPLSNEDEDEFPDSFEIVNIYPNPFNPVTTISYSLPEESNVSIRIFDILGRTVWSDKAFHVNPGVLKVYKSYNRALSV